MNWSLLTNTLLVGTGSSVLAVAFGFAAALWTVGAEARWRKAFLAAAVVALVLPPFLVTNCWIDLLGLTGAWRAWLPLNIYSLGGTVWILALLTWPIAFLFIFAAWSRVERAQIEVDPMLLGVALVRWLLLPMAKTALLQAAVLTFVLTINNFAVPALLQVKVFPAELWVSFNTTFDYSTALQLCWPMVLVPLLALLLLRRSEVGWSWRSGTVPSDAFRRQLGVAWYACGFVGGLVAILSVGLPLWQLVGSALTWRELLPALAAGQSALLHSAGFAVVTATLVVALALVAAISSLESRLQPARLRKSLARILSWPAKAGTPNLLNSLLWLPFLIPGVLLGIALIWAFNRPGLSVIYQSVGIVIVAYCVRYAALGWNAIAHAARSADPILTDAARLEGATRWQMFRHVYWPQIAVPVAAAWYVTYLLCLWDVETLVLIVPPGCESVALRIFNLLHYGHNAQVNALCLLLLVMALLPLFVWSVRRLAAPLLTCLGALALVACSPSHESGTVAIHSKFFSSVQIIGTRGGALGQFNKPRSVAVDTNDNLYVIDMTGRLQKFSPQGEFLASWQMPQTDKGKPKGMCTDHAGNIVLVEPHYSRVNHFSAMISFTLARKSPCWNCCPPMPSR